MLRRCTISQRGRGKNFALAPQEMLLLRPAWMHPLSWLFQEAQTLQTPPDLFSCLPELPQHHSAWPGAARVPQGDTQGCSVVSGGNHSNGAASLLSCWQFAFSSCIKVDPLRLLSPHLPALNGNTKSSPAEGPGLRLLVPHPTPSHAGFHPAVEQDAAGEPAPSILRGNQECGSWSFSLTQIYKCEWDKIRGFLTLVVKRSLSRLKTLNTLFFLIVKGLY